MEGTLLRSLPARVPGDVDGAAALAHVEQKLPELGAAAQRALALVEVAGRSRAEALEEMAIAPAELSRLLAAGRKALRRTVAELPAGGWCERAERLISDRLDGELSPAGEARLSAHLEGCERCGTHERRLAQAHDLLIASFVAAHVTTALALETGAPAAELRLVEETEEMPAREPGENQLFWHVTFAVAVLIVVAGIVFAVLTAAGVFAVVA